MEIKTTEEIMNYEEYNNDVKAIEFLEKKWVSLESLKEYLLGLQEITNDYEDSNEPKFNEGYDTALIDLMNKLTLDNKEKND